MNAKFAIASLALSAALSLPTAAFAQHHGGHSAGGGSHTAVVSRGSLRGGSRAGLSYGGHSYAGHSYAGRPHGGSYVRNGYRPSYYRPSYYRYGYYRPHYGPFYGGLALGLFVSSLPYYYDTYWWNGAPYYYYDNTYYRYRDSVGKYEVVAPPAEAVSDVAGPDSQIFAYPKENQSEDQQRKDRMECGEWAANETGVDSSKTEAISANRSADNRRAEEACLTGRGYSVR